MPKQNQKIEECKHNFRIERTDTTFTSDNPMYREMAYIICEKCWEVRKVEIKGLK